jgi:hypothetical protein
VLEIGRNESNPIQYIFKRNITSSFVDSN